MYLLELGSARSQINQTVDDRRVGGRDTSVDTHKSHKSIEITNESIVSIVVQKETNRRRVLEGQHFLFSFKTTQRNSREKINKIEHVQVAPISIDFVNWRGGDQGSRPPGAPYIWPLSHGPWTLDGGRSTLINENWTRTHKKKSLIYVPQIAHEFSSSRLFSSVSLGICLTKFSFPISPRQREPVNHPWFFLVKLSKNKEGKMGVGDRMSPSGVNTIIMTLTSTLLFFSTSPKSPFAHSRC
jgi:hypothetical protein